MKIVVDGFGGDYSPNEIVKGCVMAIQEIKDLEIVITGQEEKIKELLAEFKYTGDKIEVVNAQTVITCDDENPARLIRSMPDSSIVVALDVLKTRDDVVALISAGSTGAVLAGGLLKMGRIKGISRPALAPTLPTKIPGKGVVLLDCGANADCKPINYAHFAIMGSVYSQAVYGIENPRVALLSVGVEDAKGNMVSKEAFKLLKTLPINFVGNIEGRDLVSGEYDVVVSDGFSGNIALKSVEGTAALVMSKLKKAIKSSFWAKFGYLFMGKAFKQIKNELDYKQYGGSQFLGCKKPIFKAHGNSDASSIVAVIKQAMKVAKNNYNEKIEEMLTQIDIKDE